MLNKVLNTYRYITSRGSVTNTAAPLTAVQWYVVPETSDANAHSSAEHLCATFGIVTKSTFATSTPAHCIFAILSMTLASPIRLNATSRFKGDDPSSELASTYSNDHIACIGIDRERANADGERRRPTFRTAWTTNSQTTESQATNSQPFDQVNTDHFITYSSCHQPLKTHRAHPHRITNHVHRTHPPPHHAQRICTCFSRLQ
jgi:hypothetical protein